MKEKMKKLISDELKELRNDSNKTQVEIAKISGVDSSTIVRYERNNVIMQIDTLDKIISAYDMDIFSFFERIIAKTHEKDENN